MAKLKTEILRAGELWAVQVDTPGGVRLEYRYQSETQARYFAAVFELGPDVIPPALCGSPIPGSPAPFPPPRAPRSRPAPLKPRTRKKQRSRRAAAEASELAGR